MRHESRIVSHVNKCSASNSGSSSIPATNRVSTPSRATIAGPIMVSIAMNRRFAISEYKVLRRLAPKASELDSCAEAMTH